jgi:ferredoxin-NADP reductase
MADSKIKSLKRTDLFKVISVRKARIKETPLKPLPSLKSYKANQLAAALHPKCQHLKVSEVIQRNPDVKSYVLKADSDKGTKSLAWFSAGQYLSICVKAGDIEVTRPYSISSSPRESLEGYYMLTVKRAQGGLVSEYILDNWEVGTAFDASEPLGVFTYEPLRDAKQIVGIAGGSGITPFLSLAKAIADSDEDASLTLLYGSRSKADALFQKEFEEIAAKTDKFKLVNVFSDIPEKGSEKGFITAELIKKYAPQDEDYSIFLCGPQAMYDFADKEIEKLNLRRKFIRHELFGEYHNPSKNEDYKKPASDKFKLTVRICSQEKTITCSVDETLLVSMEKNGIKVPARCRSGECGWCHSKLISGEVYVPKSVDGRRLADYKFGYIHPCCTFPMSDLIIDVPPFRN